MKATQKGPCSNSWHGIDRFVDQGSYGSILGFSGSVKLSANIWDEVSHLYMVAPWHHYLAMMYYLYRCNNLALQELLFSTWIVVQIVYTRQEGALFVLFLSLVSTKWPSGLWVIFLKLCRVCEPQHRQCGSAPCCLCTTCLLSGALWGGRQLPQFSCWGWAKHIPTHCPRATNAPAQEFCCACHHSAQL